MGTYGEHAERAADALDLLIRNDRLPLTDAAVDRVLGIRHTLVIGLHDRLPHLGVQPHRPTAATPNALADAPLQELANVVGQLPRLVDEHRPSPLDALTPPQSDELSDDEVLEEWRVLAREVIAANHTLDTAEDKPWTTDAAAAWQLAGDTAQLVEGLTVLDQRLIEVGLLSDDLHHNQAPNLDRANQRLITLGAPPAEEPARLTPMEARLISGHVSRLASWHGEHTSLDLAFTRPKIPGIAEPIRTINDPGDLAAAQRHLGRLVHPTDPRTTAHRPVDAVTAGTILTSQLKLLYAIQHRFLASPDLRPHVDHVNELGGLLLDLKKTVSKFTQTRQVDQNTQALWQQREISHGLDKFHGLSALSDTQAVDFLTATEQALGTWAHGLHAEIRRSDTALRALRARKDGLLEPAPLTRNSAFTRRLVALATYHPQPAGPIFPPPAARAHLTETLTRTRHSERPPQPPGLSR